VVRPARSFFALSSIGKKSPAALFAEIGFVASGKKRGFFRLPEKP
jgi:hypothetical protein